MKLVTPFGDVRVLATRKSSAQTANGFSLEFRGLESTHLTELTMIFLIKQGKIHCRSDIAVENCVKEFLSSFWSISKPNMKFKLTENI